MITESLKKQIIFDEETSTHLKHNQMQMETPVVDLKLEITTKQLKNN
jgi:hypothetical protein